MHWPRKLSLRRKITMVIMVNTFAALCAAGIAFAEYGVHRFKELRLDAQTGALNSFVRVGPGTNGQGQGSAESRSSSSSGTGNPSERRSPELFKLGGNIKF